MIAWAKQDRPGPVLNAFSAAIISCMLGGGRMKIVCTKDLMKLTCSSSMMAVVPVQLPNSPTLTLFACLEILARAIRSEMGCVSPSHDRLIDYIFSSRSKWGEAPASRVFSFSSSESNLPESYSSWRRGKCSTVYNGDFEHFLSVVVRSTVCTTIILSRALRE